MAGSAQTQTAVVQYLRAKFGGDFTESDGTVTLSTTAQRIVKNDPERTSLVLVNNGSVTIYVAPSNTVSSTVGIPLSAGGGYLSLTIRDDDTLPTREWWAVAASGTPVLYYLYTARYATSG